MIPETDRDMIPPGPETVRRKMSDCQIKVLMNRSIGCRAKHGPNPLKSQIPIVKKIFEKIHKLLSF